MTLGPLRLLRLFGLAAALAGIGLTAQAQDYPRDTVRSIVGFPPGGTVDFNARLIANELSRLWGQQVVVENIGGSGSALGAAAAAQAPADGYTYLVVSPAHTINASLRTDLPFDTATAFTAVTQIAASPLVLYINPALDVHSVEELIAHARANPGSLNFGFSGIGASTHLALVMFNLYADVDILDVSYLGGGPLQNAVLSGEVHGCFCGAEVMVHVDAGLLRAIAVTSPERSPVYPDLPSVSETVEGYEVEAWYGVYVPAGTPADIVSQLQQAIATILQQDTARNAYSNLGFRVIGSTPEEFAAFTQQEIDRWAEVIAQANITLD